MDTTTILSNLRKRNLDMIEEIDRLKRSISLQEENSKLEKEIETLKQQTGTELTIIQKRGLF